MADSFDVTVLRLSPVGRAIIQAVAAVVPLDVHFAAFHACHSSLCVLAVTELVEKNGRHTVIARGLHTISRADIAKLREVAAAVL